MKKSIIYSILIIFTLGVTFISCEEDKDKWIYDGGTFYSFIKKQSGSFYVQDTPDATYTIEIGTTTKSNKDRTVSFEVDATSTAISGTHYSLGSTTVTIPAKEVIGELVVNGIYAGFTGEAVTLIIKLNDPKVASFDTVYTLTLQQYCAFDINSFVGTWDVHDVSLYGAEYNYQVTTELDPLDPMGLIVNNLWEESIPVKITFDDTDPANFICRIMDQYYDTDGTYGEMRIRDLESGTFSACDMTISTSYAIYVAAGYFDQVLPSEWTFVPPK